VDLLREEAEKAPEAGIEIEQRRETVQNAPDIEDEAEEVASAPELETSASTPLPELTSSVSRAKRTGPTKAELEITVTELREVVQEAQHKETYLQQRTDDLQSALNEQKTLVEKLQSELEEAKKLILQLSASAKTTQKKTPKSRTIALQKLPQQTAQPNSSPEMFSNKGIGWAD